MADGWLALLYGGEEQSASYSGMMIIGKIGEFQNVNQKELKELFGEDGISAVLSIRN